jgi:hypothetical protein
MGFYFIGFYGALWGIVASNFLFLPLVISYSAHFDMLDPRKEIALLPIILVGYGIGEIVRLVIPF